MADFRPQPLFVGDHLALDFLNSVAAPAGEWIEWIGSGRDLLSWLEQAGAVPPAVGAQLRGSFGSHSLDDVAVKARELREWFRAFVAKHAGKPLRERCLTELTSLNQLLEKDEIFRQIELADMQRAEEQGPRPTPFRWRSERCWSSPDSLLLPIAEAMGDLVCSTDFDLVRQCDGPSCTLWFADVSKAHARRWCSMAICGNRAKAAAHRARTRSTAANAATNR